MRTLRWPARAYITGVLAAAAVFGAAGILLAPPHLSMGPVALLLLAAAVTSQQFKVTTPKHQSYYTTTIFFVAAALLLHPAYAIAIVVGAHLVELVRVRQAWYIQSFNIANFVLCALLATLVFGLGPVPAVLEPATVIRGLVAGFVFVLLNHLLTALVIMWARGVALQRAGTLSWENLGTDLALMSIGVLGAMLWRTEPWLVPLCLAPLFLVYRSLLVPTLQEEARTDPKTELFNMKHWNQVANAELERAVRFQRPLSVALADLDLLRDVNNTYGHLQGDQLIRQVANAIRGAIRNYDLPARFGGDEFAILMPETAIKEAERVAERVRRAVEAMRIRVDGGPELAITLSIGVAQLAEQNRAASDLLAAADRAVYQAKALGRNRVCRFEAPVSEPVRPRAISVESRAERAGAGSR